MIFLFLAPYSGNDIFAKNIKLSVITRNKCAAASLNVYFWESFYLFRLRIATLEMVMSLIPLKQRCLSIKIHCYFYTVKKCLIPSSERGVSDGDETVRGCGTTFACFLHLRTLVGFFGKTRRTLRMSGVACSPGLY